MTVDDEEQMGVGSDHLCTGAGTDYGQTQARGERGIKMEMEGRWKGD